MSFTSRVDDSAMRKQHASMLRRGGLARSAGVQEMARQVCRVAFASANHDTNRFRRAIALMHNQMLPAGGGGRDAIPVPPLRQSDEVLTQRKRLERQIKQSGARVKSADKTIETWDPIANRVDPPPKSLLAMRGNASRKRKAAAIVRAAKRTKRKAEKQVARAEEELALFDRSPFAIVMGGRRTKSAAALGRLSTVRTKVYGGTATVRELGAMTVVELRNKEPHARIVEKRDRTMRGALAAGFRGTGLRRIGRRHLEAATAGRAPLASARRAS